MKLAVFDDFPVKFYPVSLTRSTGDIRCGILKLRQRLQALLFGDEEIVILDESLIPLYRERHSDWLLNSTAGDTLFANSRIIINPEIIAKIRNLKLNQGIIDQAGSLVALRVEYTNTNADYPSFQAMAAKAEMEKVGKALYQNMADIIADNSRLIEFDFEQFFQEAENFMETEPGVTILNPYKAWIGEDAVLSPGVVIDATHGPVVIDEKAQIMSHAVITGPAYIGKNTVIKIGAKIYGGTSIGPVCKVGGEIEGSIIQAYSNKQHDGFLGHAYLGEWVNIGAGTSNSDLKNNYKPVAFHSYAENARIQSGYQFLGSIIGDHTKTGINCTLNTGVVIGAGCNLWGREMISDYIPSLSWGEACSLTPNNFEAFSETARMVKLRRKLVFTETEEALYSKLWHREH
jgi:UDP-N-acetylglucosamine diphosphorylase/glucosamine-1-phosphate N-acetyltransferase